MPNSTVLTIVGGPFIAYHNRSHSHSQTSVRVNKQAEMSSSSSPFVSSLYTTPSFKSDSKPLKTADLLHTFTCPFELKQVHAQLIKVNAPISNLPLFRAASVCALTPSFSYAQQILQLSHKTDYIIWNTCLNSFAQSDCPVSAIRLFYQLRDHDICMDDFTFSILLKACLKLSDLLHGRIVHGFIEKLGFQSDLFLQNTMVHLYSSCGATDDARLLFDKMPEREVVTWNIIITQLAKRGDIEGAFEFFSWMPERNVRSWGSMIAGFVKCGKPREAINLFTQMEKEGFVPNEVTVVAVLAACADLGALDLGKRIHEFSNQRGYKSNVRISNSLIYMYTKCGCLEAARRVFEEMEERTVASWSAMIRGLAIHGKAEEAMELFSEMTRIGVKPDDITFIGLLHACSLMGLVNEGRKFFASMSRDYGIITRIEHFGCMVDLLSRAGHIQEAYELIKSMPMKPHAVVWGALLGGCRVHKNIEVAEEATKHIVELDPTNGECYAVLSNIYAEARRWREVERVRKLMRDKGVRKIRGQSSITVNGTVHEFVAGDLTHPQAEEIIKKWDDLLEKMRSKGYTPNTSVVLLDMEENDKVKVLYRHSEKLAVMFGLINTQHGAPIKIIKNFRVCEDCHAALKILSKIANREIIVRDRNRFHSFKDGSCSCRDYW